MTEAGRVSGALRKPWGWERICLPGATGTAELEGSPGWGLKVSRAGLSISALFDS